MAVVLLTAFVAGFLLNFMPCVLPVIGLKVMAFVQQAGDSRGRVFWLNFWYCLGLMSVFFVLATLAVTIGLSWGQQFSSATFNIVLSAVVFVFALSFLGVWEIPIPGLCRIRRGAVAGRTRRTDGCFREGHSDHHSGHAVQRTDAHTGADVGRLAAPRDHLCRIRLRRAGHGQPVLDDRHFPAAGGLSAEARSLDGYIQAHHGLCA